MQSAPRPVYAAFAICLLLGALSVSSAVEDAIRVGIVRGDALSRGFWALVLFGIAVGLSRRSKTARGLVDLGIAFTLIPAVLVPFGVLLAFGLGVEEAKLSTIAWALFMGAIAFYLWKGLHTPESDAWFDGDANADDSSNLRGFQLSTLLLLTAVLAVAFGRVEWSELPYAPRSIESTYSAIDGDTVIAYTVGTKSLRTNQSQKVVDFVVMEVSNSGSLSSRVSTASTFSSSGPSDSTATVELPNGETLSLPSDARLVEIHDAAFRTSTETVTWDQLKAYMDSSPKRPSIAGLLAFEPPSAED